MNNTPKIRHIVLSGGGPLLFQFIGAMQRLHESHIWNKEDIETIYATSCGTMLAVCILLMQDMDAIVQYFVRRPWNKDIRLYSPAQLFELYTKKGLLDKSVFETAFKPIFHSCNLSLTTTMKELYEHTHKDVHFFTVDVNSFSVVDISHETHPDVSVIDAITMSCSIPGLFAPVFVPAPSETTQSCCYIDGGLFANYPLPYLLKRYPETSPREILSLTIADDDEPDKHQQQRNMCVTDTMNIIDFMLIVFKKSIVYMSSAHYEKEHAANMSPQSPPTYELKWSAEHAGVSLQIISQLIDDWELRNEWVSRGKNIASEFIDKLCDAV